MLDELQHDYGMHNKSDSEKPLFHRIKFEGASIYLTRASYYDKVVNTGATSMGDYRIFSWQDSRAQAFLGFELGQKSPVLGSANLIGSFKPTLDDLTEVKYSTFDGKAYYESARDAIENPGKKHASNGDAKVRKIDADTFMKMNEIIPTGLQGKAIYGEGNYIIDGPAGTGKSTTVLQKIKLLQLHSNVKSNDICLIVKNTQVVQPFDSLLQSIGINDIKTYSQQDFVEAFYPNEMTLAAEDMQDAYRAVNNLVSDFEAATNLSDLVSLQLGSIKPSPPPTGSDEFDRIMRSLVKKCDNFLTIKGQLNEEVSKLRKTNTDESYLFGERQKNKLLTDKKKKLRTQIIGRFKKEISDDVSLFEENLTKKVLAGKKKGLLSRIGIRSTISELDLNDRTTIRGEVKEYESLRYKELDKKNSDVDNSTFELDLGDESDIRNLVKEYENKKKEGLDRKVKENKGILKLKMDELEGVKASLTAVFSSISNVEKVFKGTTQETVSASILQRMIRKNYQESDDFHTIIIDEAQDVTAVTIEFVRLKAKNTILVGDESQRELVGGVGRWQDVISSRDAFLNKEGRLNIYSLRHNFRQTYELGAVSYNYRQLTLNKPIEDIKGDYFEDQIGYLKPSLKKIDSHSDFHQLIDSKISYINERFTKTFPLVVFYENDKSRDRLNDILGCKFTTLIGDDMSSECDILLVSSKNIAGREFPVVIAPLTASTKNSTVYVMMSRAKIDLTLVLAEGRKPNVHIDKLCSEKLITTG